MAPALKGKSGSVAATAKGAKGVKAPAVVKSDGPLLPVDPLLLGAAWRTFLGVKALTNPKAFVEKQFDAKSLAAGGASKGSEALALRCGLLNLQVAALQVAACNANMKTETKRNLHVAMAVNNFSSAILAHHNKTHRGLSQKEGNLRTMVTLGLGVLAAATAIKEQSQL